MSEELPVFDHRRIGRELNLFHVQEDAAGSVFWHPRGYTLFRIIENYIRERLRLEGYTEVKTPQLVDKSLWEKSGHWDKFRKNMFLATDAEPSSEINEHVLGLKPMNCPCHVQIFNARSVSYRQLPMRMAEFGCCHRNEPSGALHGIMRVRQFTQDDAHIFCTEEQVTSETEKFIQLLLSVYKDFGFNDIKIGFSTRPDVRAGTDEQWDYAEKSLSDAVSASGLTYEVYKGEGAFYGPKLEFALSDLRGREWQCGTLQLDLVLPGRLDAKYTDKSGERKAPIMLHRAILGSMERFIGILLEHYEGRLPHWLAPQQYVVVPIKADDTDLLEYSQIVHSLLESGPGLRGSIDNRDEHFNSKIKEHSAARIPFILVVGAREAHSSLISIRRLGETKSEIMALADVQDLLGEVCRQPTIGFSIL